MVMPILTGLGLPISKIRFKNNSGYLHESLVSFDDARLFFAFCKTHNYSDTVLAMTVILSKFRKQYQEPCMKQYREKI